MDGDRQLVIHSDHSFTYYPKEYDFGSVNPTFTPPDPEKQISDFLHAYGFDAEVQIVYSEIHGGYYALPLSPDGFPLRYDNFIASGFVFYFDRSGIIQVNAELLAMDRMGTFRIISAEEAFLKVLDSTPGYGLVEAFVSPSGGGGGGSLGLYKVNLSGTPVPLPTEVVKLVPQVGQVIDGQRGMLSVTLFNQPNGSQRVEYRFFIATEYYSTTMLLEGEGLESLQAVHNRPVSVWGSITEYDELFNFGVIKVERFEVPFPVLQFQILRGTQQKITIDGIPAVLFTTTEGQTYIQMSPWGVLESELLGVEGDEVLFEALLIPDDSFGGFPAVRLFVGTVVSHEDGVTTNMFVTADQPGIMDEPVEQEYDPPTATIESIELVYFLPDPRSTPVTSAEPAYIQPMWRFSGHYSAGDAFEIMVQALWPEFLLPEIQLLVPPG